MAAQKKSFEALYAELEDTTRRLEEGNLPLEDSLKLYEQGAALVEELRKILDEAELHVKTLQVRLQPQPPAFVEPYGGPGVDAPVEVEMEFEGGEIEPFEFEDDFEDV